MQSLPVAFYDKSLICFLFLNLVSTMAIQDNCVNDLCIYYVYITRAEMDILSCIQIKTNKNWDVDYYLQN